MKPRVRCHYWGEGRPLVNLGDALVPVLLDALGFTAVPRTAADRDVINPGRCLLVIGSLLTQRDLQQINYPVDVWGCGWKGVQQLPQGNEDVRFFAVRGPHTLSRLQLPATTPQGDPALLLPVLHAMDISPHGRSVLIPHCSRLHLAPARQRLAATGCDELLSPMVLRPPAWRPLLGTLLHTLRQLAVRRWRYGIRSHGLWHSVQRLAGARFVLTGSLHGAILAQAFGVPWACYADGYLDAAAKWNDWGAWLGIDIEVVTTLAAGERWWQACGRHGQVRDLGPLLRAFPYSASAAADR